jgi:hypothetical protein
MRVVAVTAVVCRRETCLYPPVHDLHVRQGRRQFYPRLVYPSQVVRRPDLECPLDVELCHSVAVCVDVANQGALG